MNVVYLFLILGMKAKNEIYWSFMLLGVLQDRHGEFEPGKVQYSTPIFFWLVVSYKSVLKPKI